MNNNRILLVVDSSNFEHCVVNAAVSLWVKSDPFVAGTIIKKPNETDQSDLPNPVNYDDFRRILRRTAEKKFESLKWIVRNNHQEEVNIADGIDIFFTFDAPLEKTFRKRLFPEYKQQRRVQPRSFNPNPARDFVRNVIYKDMELEDVHHVKFIKRNDCESDDIVAILMKNYTDYMCRILISSDRDFLQIENVHQYDLFGKEVTYKVKNHPEYEMNKKEFLTWKIIQGDKSDNIKGVFEGVGEVGAYNLVKNPDKLKDLLKESEENIYRFTLNRNLIDFRKIPQNLEQKILESIKEKMNEIEMLYNKSEDFDLEGCMIC